MSLNSLVRKISVSTASLSKASNYSSSTDLESLSAKELRSVTLSNTKSQTGCKCPAAYVFALRKQLYQAKLASSPSAILASDPTLRVPHSVHGATEASVMFMSAAELGQEDSAPGALEGAAGYRRRAETPLVTIMAARAMVAKAWSEPELPTRVEKRVAFLDQVNVSVITGDDVKNFVTHVTKGVTGDTSKKAKKKVRCF